jgi:hypothetical protein
MGCWLHRMLCDFLDGEVGVAGGGLDMDNGRDGVSVLDLIKLEGRQRM